MTGGGCRLAEIRYLLDTGMAARLLRRDDGRVLGRLAELRPGDVGISAITRGELEFAARMSRAPERDLSAVALLLEFVAVLELPGEAAAHYAEIREALYWKAVEMSETEALVAAHARWLGVALVTAKVREWGKVPGLRVEGWG